MVTMTMSRRFLPPLLAAALFLIGSFAGAQTEALSATALGHEGTVFRLYQGLYGELFPEGAEAEPDSPVLALDVRYSGGLSERLLVPGTETDDQDSSASMVFEDTTGVVYLAWETLFNGQHPLLQLTSFDGVEWSETIEVTGNVFAGKGVPELVVRRETDRVTVDGVEVRKSRTTLHMSWWEEATEAISRKLHALIILDDGQYIGWTPILDLGNYLLEDEGFAPAEVPGLENALRLQPGRDHRRVVVGFVNPQTHRLITLEIEALSQVISTIADQIRAQIVVIGLQADTPAELAEMARDEVLAQGTAFHESARQYLADQVAATVEQSEVEFSPAGIESIADQIRAQIVVIGLRIGNGGLFDPVGSEIIAVAKSATAGEPEHYYQVTVASDRPAPEVGAPAELMLSDSGRNVIVTWDQEGYVFYLESLGDGWSEPSSIELSEDLDREAVYRMLSERVRAD